MKNQIRNILTVLMIALNASAISQTDSARAKFETLPIVSYDSDVGFGYGAKIFFFDQFKLKESFDLILFNSTKGERWYKFVFSIPDFEARQGTKYPIALDLVIEYDKFTNYIYYHNWNPFIGFPYTDENIEDKDIGTYEKANVGIFVSRAFLKDFTATLALQLKSFSLYNFANHDSDYYLYVFNSNSKPESATFLSALINIKWDTRNSFINPKSGIITKLEIEYSKNLNLNDMAFLRALFSFSFNKEIFSKDLIFAFRGSSESVAAFKESSYFSLIHIGGNNTVRGIPMDKYCFDSALLFNSELRFPIWWRFGGILGIDLATGKNDTFGYLNRDAGWLFGTVAGLRFYMDNFIVRADLGISKNSSGLYLNFGHMF
ncbi:MAG: BamA/TamA family outer membrane protein [Ignavibacterium sp.]|uniref:BamA/TamA family outer membrane protein n=1 Tax=Ignavibacterium sp. TaxID=2651167 RepID=UPI003298624E